MPRPSRPWFRFYVEAFGDLKLRRLTPEQRWVWVAVLGAARQSCEPGRLLIAPGVPMSDLDLSAFSNVTPSKVVKALRAMESLGMVSLDGDTWTVPRWGDRQFESDDVTERTRKHRAQERGRNVPTLFEGTDQRQRQIQKTPPTPPPVDNVTPRGAAGGGLNELGAEVSGAVRALARAGSWRSIPAALTQYEADGTLDRLRDYHRRFPTAPAGDLVQLLDGGPLLRRYIDTEEAPS